jgi:5'-methylthioadenosine phosphorylase
MARIGIVSGTIFLQNTGILADPEERLLETPFGPAQAFLTDRVAFIPRHGNDPGRHILPHDINHPANLAALKALGVQEVIAVNSTGSLKRALEPGMAVIPDDFIMLYPGPTVFTSTQDHITPILDEGVRRRFAEAARDCRIPIIEGGVYWQTAGPRFETRAEIRLMAQAADVVGMTMASEAIVARELGLAYGSVCSIDNYAHGLVDTPLTQEEVLCRARQNSEKAATLIKRYLERIEI